MRPYIDTRANFTIIDTNHSSSEFGTLNTFSYYAANTNPFRFVLVDELNVVQWVSDEITPPDTGAQSLTPTPVYVEPNWNLGLYFKLTGTVPYISPGAPAFYEYGGAGVPILGETLSYQASQGRIYSFVATGDVAELPSVPTITWPANGVYITTAALTHIEWTDSIGTFTPLVYKYEAYGDADYTSLIYSSGWLNVSEISSPGTPEDVYYIRVMAKDNMGNLSDWSNGSTDPYIIYKITVDNTKPVVMITTPANDAEYILGETVLADWSATDALSGIASAIGTVPSGVAIDTNSVGAKEFTVTATDNAGNTNELTHTYHVYYGFNELLAPYQAPPKAFKAGSSIPLKWQYTDLAGSVVDSPSAHPQVFICFAGSAPASDGNPIEVNDPGASGYQYDSDTHTWQFNWQTKGKGPGYYNITIKSIQTGQVVGPFQIQLK